MNFNLGQILKQILNFIKSDQLTRVGPDLLNFVNFVAANPTDLFGGNLQLAKFSAALLADEQQVGTDTAKFALGLLQQALNNAINAKPATPAAPATAAKS